MKCVIQPVGKPVTVVSVFIEDEEVSHATVGESVTMKVAGGVSEEDLRKGYVLCPVKEPCRAIPKFKAQFKILELPEGRPVMTAGYVDYFWCGKTLGRKILEKNHIDAVVASSLTQRTDPVYPMEDLQLFSRSAGAARRVLVPQTGQKSKSRVPPPQGRVSAKLTSPKFLQGTSA